MTISTYSELQSAITNWLGGRTDLTSYYPDWITLAESHIARALRIRLTETSASISLTAGVGSLPSDYMSWRAVTFNTGSSTIDLEYMHPSKLTEELPTTPSGVPQFFTIKGTSITVVPTTTGTVTMYYYKRNAALSSAVNTLFTNYPDLFLWGALTEAHSFLADMDQLQVAKARRDEILEEIQLADYREQGSLQIRLSGATP